MPPHAAGTSITVFPCLKGDDQSKKPQWLIRRAVMYVTGSGIADVKKDLIGGIQIDTTKESIELASDCISQPRGTPEPGERCGRLRERKYGRLGIFPAGKKVLAVKEVDSVFLVVHPVRPCIVGRQIPGFPSLPVLYSDADTSMPAAEGGFAIPGEHGIPCLYRALGVFPKRRTGRTCGTASRAGLTLSGP